MDTSIYYRGFTPRSPHCRSCKTIAAPPRRLRRSEPLDRLVLPGLPARRAPKASAGRPERRDRKARPALKDPPESEVLQDLKVKRGLPVRAARKAKPALRASAVPLARPESRPMNSPS
jgi:hypothetical protein